MVTMTIIALIFSCSIKMSSAQSQFPNMESTEFPYMDSTEFPNMESTEFSILLSTSDFYESNCYYYNSISCDNANNYGSIHGSISEYEIACIEFSIPVQQDVTFSTCQSSFDTVLAVGNSEGIISSDVCYNSDDCGNCGRQERFSMTLDAGDYIILVSGYTSGDYTLVASCGDVFPYISSTEFPYLESTEFPDFGIRTTVYGLSCDYIDSISCNANNYGTRTGYIGKYQTACILFSNPEEQDVTFSTCPSSFDTKLYVANDQGEKISTSVCDGDDCGAEYCYNSNREVFTMESLDANDYVIIVEGWSSSSGRYTVEMFCGDDVFPDISSTDSSEFPEMSSTDYPDDMYTSTMEQESSTMDEVPSTTDLDFTSTDTMISEQTIAMDSSSTPEATEYIGDNQPCIMPNTLFMIISALLLVIL